MDSHLSQFIRQGLIKTGLNQAQFVRAMGYQNTAKGHRRLTAWLRGEETPNEVQVRRIAEALDVSPEAVFKAIVADKEAPSGTPLARHNSDNADRCHPLYSSCVAPACCTAQGSCPADRMCPGCQGARSGTGSCLGPSRPRRARGAAGP